MADIELVIKIPKEVKNRLCFGVTYPKDIQVVCEALDNGTPLPEGHGRLGDLDALREEVSSWGMNDYEPLDFIDAIDGTDTIIEADRTESEG